MSDVNDRVATLSPAKRALFELLTRKSAPPARPPIPRQAVRSPAPLSFGQERLWFLYRLDPDSAAYTIPFAVRYQGVLTADTVARALEYLVARHEVLRTTIRDVDGEPKQVIAPSSAAALTRVELPADTADWMAEAAALAREAVAQPIVLEQGPLFRTTHIVFGPAQHVLVFVMHHIISDAGTLERLVREFAACCAAFAAGQEPQLPALPIQFGDFAGWQREWFTGNARGTQLQYWRITLAGLSPLELPTDAPRPPVQRFRGKVRRFDIPAATTAALRALGRRHDATPFMTLLAGFVAFLHRYTRQSDIVVGSPVTNRVGAELEHVLGLFANTIVLRIDCSGEPSADTLIGRTRKAVLDALEHQDLPFEQLVEELQPARDLSRNPLFQAMFIYRRRSRGEEALAADALPIDTATTKFDVTLTFEEYSDHVAGFFEYDTDLFGDETAARMVAHLTVLLGALAADPLKRVDDLPILEQGERARILSPESLPPDRSGDAGSLLSKYAAIASTSATHEAVICGDERVTYRALDDRSGRIAALLRNRGVGDGTLVAMALDRSPAMVAATLGIARAGAAYVPLDPSFPAERIALMLKDAAPAVILTTTQLAGSLPADAIGTSTVIALDSPATQGELAAATPFAPATVDPESLAYVLYTSGSTGRPKGVQVTHGALANFLDSMRKAPGLDPSDRLVAVTTMAFDIAGLELWLPLTTGATVVVATTDESRDARKLAALIARERASVLQATPSTWRLLLDAGWRNTERMKILVGGEPLPVDLARALLGVTSELWNMYGPTETTIWSTIQRVTSARHAVPIGRPIANTRVYVLDHRLEPVPPGVVGDLYIGGHGLARGYLHLPGLTADAFIPDPHAGEPGARMYRTGDLARMRADGVLEFLGRGDHQVKLRGFRIELGDVEAALAAHPSVGQAVADLRTTAGGDASLVAWLCPATGQTVDPAAVRGFLRERLPDYMVPSTFVPVAALPLTPNGKIDRRALPAPTRSSATGKAGSRAPSTDAEHALMALWREMLGVEVHGVDEDFFELGGHSMLAARLLTRVRDLFGVDIPLRALFEAPTVAGLARALTTLEEGGTLDLFSPVLRAAMSADSTLDPAIRPADADRTPLPLPIAQHVFLTGATGFLGAHLLAELLASTTATISCLVRCTDARSGAARVRETLERFAIWNDAFTDRIVVVPGDLDRPRLGLSVARFEALGASLDAIFHNGALVNFITPYRQLRAANVLGTIEVLRLAAARSTPLHYVSTTDVLGAGYYTAREDDPLDEPNGLKSGYAQSKWVAEHLVRAAGARGLPVAIYRPGRIVGHSRTGIWNTDDFACRAIRGAIELGAVPDIDPLDNMAPVDYVARAIVAIAQQPVAFAQPAFHVINPAFFLWRRLFDYMRRRGYALVDVPYGEWRRRLAADATNPLAPLLPLFPVPPEQEEVGARWASVPVAQCAHAQSALEGTSVTCPPLDDALWDTYFDYFVRCGYLASPDGTDAVDRGGAGPRAGDSIEDVRGHAGDSLQATAG